MPPERARWIPVEGTSMWPALRPGDEAALSPVDAPLAIGDVVVARTERGLLIHRVRRVLDDGALVLRGDACAEDDAPIPATAVLAQVRRVRRRDRLLLRHEWDRGWLASVSALLRARHRLGALRRRLA